MTYTLEVCVDSVASALAAKRGGADRLELCADLIIGGTTPSLALVRQVKAETGLPVRALLRPRFGDFCYDRYELAQMAETAAALAENILCCDIHTRARSKRLLKAAGARVVLGLDDLLNRSVDGSGYNAEYGLLGSNKATEETVKLFPKDCDQFVARVAASLKEQTGKNIEAMVYGDGAFKDPVGKIWELADPVVSPGYTKGLVGTPNELKLKYLADNDFGDLKGEALKEAIEERIREKTSESLVGNMVSEGTTPRRLTDLIGSLCDLTSGSGDKGTPIVYIQGYFDNYSND